MLTSQQGREGDTDNRSSVRDLRDLRDLRDISKLVADVTSKSRPDNILPAICPQPVFLRPTKMVSSPSGVSLSVDMTGG